MEQNQERFRKTMPLKFMAINLYPQTQIKHWSKSLKFGQAKSIWKVIIYTQMPDNLSIKDHHHLY